MSIKVFPGGIETLLRVGLWTVLLAVVTYTRTDPDLWGHVRFGLDVLRDKALHHTDPYSFTSDQRWINHEWAAETLSGIAFAVAGASGLVVLKLGTVGGALVLLLRHLKLDGVLTPRRRDLLGAAAVITTVQQAHHVRPQIFSLLFFTVLLTVLVWSDTPTRRRWLLAVPMVFAAWANFHGGWIVGGAVLALWTAGSALVAPGKRARAVSVLLATGAVSFVATLANPYGFGLWRFLWQTVGIDRADITDWQPVYALDPSVWGLWILTAALAGLGLVRGRRSLDRRRILVVAVLAFGSFFVNRLLGFFGVATILLFGSAIVGTSAPPAATTVPSQRRSTAAGLMISGAMIVGGLVAIAVNVACIRIDQRTSPEPEAVSVLRAQTAGNRLLVWFDWGQYAFWHLAPSMKVSIDGRRETVYSASLQSRHLKFFFDAPGGAELVTQIGADYVWIPSVLPAARRLKATGWTLLYEGNQSAIFARPGLALGPVASTASNSKIRCFPDH